jgi:hypothetical protein
VPRHRLPHVRDRGFWPVNTTGRSEILLAELQGRLHAVLGARDQMQGLLRAVLAIGEDRLLAEFIPVGLSGAEITAIHHWPQSRGLRGLLIRDPSVLVPAAPGWAGGFPLVPEDVPE